MRLKQLPSKQLHSDRLDPPMEEAMLPTGRGRGEVEVERVSHSDFGGSCCNGGCFPKGVDLPEAMGGGGGGGGGG